MRFITRALQQDPFLKQFCLEDMYSCSSDYLWYPYYPEYASNEKVYYIMEALNDAINSRKKVSFQYFTFNVRKEQKLRHDGYTYVFSPFKLIWNSGS